MENDCITRLYWTDNFKPIRSLNLSDPNAFAFSQDGRYCLMLFKEFLKKKYNIELWDTVAGRKIHTTEMDKTIWNVAGGFIRALIWIGEAIWYDPEYVSTIIGALGEWSGIETFESVADAMQDWPKYGVKIANNFFGTNQ